MENNNIIDQLEKLLKETETEKKHTENYNSLNEANDSYNELIRSGVVKKRGYSLRGIEDAHLFSVCLNS